MNAKQYIFKNAHFYYSWFLVDKIDYHSEYLSFNYHIILFIK